MLSWPCRAHGIRLAGARLAVGEDGDVVALDKRVDAVGHIVEDAFLVNVLAKDTVEDEDLPAARCIHGQTRGRSDVTGCMPKPLGDEFEAWLACLEWRADTDSCEALLLGDLFVLWGGVWGGTYRL